MPSQWFLARYDDATREASSALHGDLRRRTEGRRRLRPRVLAAQLLQQVHELLRSAERDAMSLSISSGSMPRRERTTWCCHSAGKKRS